jgi:hypothetical protein
MVNKYGKKKKLIQYHSNERMSYNFDIDTDGYCFEYTYDDKGNELTYKNSDGFEAVGTKLIELTKNDYFEKVVTDTLSELKELLIVKGKEYRRNDNVYHNFDQGAKIKGITPEKVLDGFLLKHEISIADMTNDLDKGIMPSKEKVEEKFNDNIIYLLIKKAMILNRLK